jgi:hypothetical protein
MERRRKLYGLIGAKVRELKQLLSILKVAKRNYFIALKTVFAVGTTCE